MNSQMTYLEYMSYAAEINTLKRLLEGLPEERAIEGIGFECRLRKAQQKIEGVSVPPRPKKLSLSFTGEPVQDHHGIDANFAAEAISNICDAVRLTAAGAAGELKPTGQIPRNAMGQPIITGATLDSCGFELELPFPEDDPHGFSYPEQAVHRIQTLLKAATEGTDEELTEATRDIHPRAVKKTAALLEIMRKRNAQLAIQYQDNRVELRNRDDTERAAERLNRCKEGQLQSPVPQ